MPNFREFTEENRDEIERRLSSISRQGEEKYAENFEQQLALLAEGFLMENIAPMTIVDEITEYCEQHGDDFGYISDLITRITFERMKVARIKKENKSDLLVDVEQGLVNRITSSIDEQLELLQQREDITQSEIDNLLQAVFQRLTQYYS